MNLVTTQRSPNFSDLVIPVEFVVLHYTAANLQRTLEIFLDTSTEVSAHLVIDRDGAVYEMVECLSGAPKRAWHAGKSRCEVSRGGERALVEGLNDCSIGIELVNLNGNIFPYTEAQYTSLFAVLDQLKGVYAGLAGPESILGHEHVAGFRGKCDPGRCFEWGRLYSVCYPGQGMPRRVPLCSELMAGRLLDVVKSLGVGVDRDTGAIVVPPGLPQNLFGLLSALCEGALTRES